MKLSIRAMPPLRRTIKEMTDGRGADLVIIAASAKGIVEQAVAISRPGARILLFAQTSHQERIEVSGADICMGERMLCGSYSASVDVQKRIRGSGFFGRPACRRIDFAPIFIKRYSCGN